MGLKLLLSFLALLVSLVNAKSDTSHAPNFLRYVTQTHPPDEVLFDKGIIAVGGRCPKTWLQECQVYYLYLYFNSI
jgi:hypothetical protein